MLYFLEINKGEKDMKKFFILMIASMFLLSSCGTRTAKKSDETVKDTTETVSVDSTTVVVEDTVVLE